jgi:hypothetical protein
LTCSRAKPKQLTTRDGSSCTGPSLVTDGAGKVAGKVETVQASRLTVKQELHNKCFHTRKPVSQDTSRTRLEHVSGSATRQVLAQALLTAPLSAKRDTVFRDRSGRQVASFPDRATQVISVLEVERKIAHWARLRRNQQR